eukprot:7910914-Alexandrium_andersonii.AAC.2
MHSARGPAQTPDLPAKARIDGGPPPRTNPLNTTGSNRQSSKLESTESSAMWMDRQTQQSCMPLS